MKRFVVNILSCIFACMVFVFGGVCAANADAKFTLTTTTGQTTFSFSLSVIGTFTVDCSDGGVLSGTGVSGNTITRSNTTKATYTCTWNTEDRHTIWFDGEATGYNTGTSTAAISFYVNSSNTKIASIDGNLSSMFPYMSNNAATGAQPRFYQTFYNATNLIQIPETLFADYTTVANYMFQYTFYGCSGLTSIPEKLFSNIENTTNATYLFSSTFSGCSGLTTIPEDLFSSITTGTTGMFQSTFNSCKGLTSIPEDLFSSITTGASYMFQYTFAGCSGLTSIPEDLFSSITTGASYMFQYTFSVCSGLTTIPEDLFSSITTGANYMFSGTFQSCSGLTTIPENLFSSVTTSASYMFDSTFNSCRGLTSIPGDLFSSITTGAEGMFRGTFQSCSGLTTVPGSLFSSVTTSARYMFDSTFNSCSGLTSIPGNLFSNITTGQYYMFSSTFQSCSGLTTVPGSLFSGITTGAEGMFSSTFRNCTNLTNVPENLFAGIETAASYMFISTFYNCSNLSGYIPSSTFAGLIAKNHPTASYMWNSTFNSTKLWTSCSEHGLEQYITGYEGSSSSTWNGKVSCVPGNITYVLNGGVNYSNAPYGYVEGTGVVIDGIPTKAGHVFTGWCTDSELTSCAMGQTIGADATGDKIFYAKWTECTACATINASCAISVVNNVCTYATSCDNEYGNIQNNGQYNASCSALAEYNITYIVDGGTNYANAPTSYYETVGTTVNGIPTKDGFVFAGWCTDSELTSCAMGQTIGADATGDKIFYAKWTECTACATTNASCAISVVNNVCKYVTSCNPGYGNIQNNGQYNASCVLPSDIIYVMNGGTNYANALTGYYEGVGVTINCVPTKLEHVFAGWCTDSELENCAMSQTIGTTATGPQTFYAKWTECAECATINASCAFASVENNVCKYNTVCDDGYYNITNNGSYNASCSACGGNNYYCSSGVRSTVSSGYYSTGGTETTRTGQSQCESGFYCANGVRNECPSEYANSVAGATVSSQCYRACNTSNVEHSAIVSGNDYYDNGKDTCTAETCETGYFSEVINADLTTLDSSVSGTTYGYVNNSGSVTRGSLYGLTSNDRNAWGASFRYGKLVGKAFCSSSSGQTYGPGTPNEVTSGRYCWCRATGYVDGDTNTSSLTGTIKSVLYPVWIYAYNYSSTSNCTSSCAYYCGYYTINSASLRSALFTYSGSGTISQCFPEVYDIVYVLDGGTNYNDAPTTHTFGTSVTIDGVPTKGGAIFAGWCTDAELQNCAMSQTISASVTGSQTFYAKWTGCEAGYYCENGVINECPSGYENSAAGASAINQCYRACTTSNIKHSVTVSGNDYYGDGKDTCVAEVCETGYVIQSAVDISSLNLGGYIHKGCVDNNGNYSGISAYNLTNNDHNTWGVTYDAGKIIGESLCSITSGTSNQVGVPDKNTQDRNCWCRAMKYVDGDTSLSTITGVVQSVAYPAWVFLGDVANLSASGQPLGSTSSMVEKCAWNCPFYCASYIQSSSAFRQAMFLGEGGAMNRCGTTISYVLNGGTNYSDAPLGYEEGNGTVVNGVPVKAGSVFAGWCTDSGLQNCAMSQTIGTTATGSRTFYAKWTECPACAVTNASCAFEGVEDNVCKYTTTCNTGYGDIQNNGAYNASCSLSTYAIDYDLSGGISGITCSRLPSGYTELEYLQSTAAGSVVDTGLSGVPSNWEIVAQEVTTRSGSRIIVGYSGNIPGWFGVVGNGKYGCGTSSGWYADVPGTTKATINLSINSENTTVSGTVNGMAFSRSDTGYPSTSVTYKLFGYSSYSFLGKIWYAKGTVNNTEFHLIPARRNSDNKLGMYDIVNNVFRASSGTFSSGPDSSCEVNYSGAPTTYTYGIGAEIDGIPTREGSVFAGWCTDSGLQNCAMSQTIGTTATGSRTFYAKWTECPACAATNASCAFEGVEDNVCKYTTTCNTGYGDIQNNGAYNASCSANDITLVYQDEVGNEMSTGSCEYGTVISLPDAPVKQGYKFKGWTVVPAE